MINFKFFLRYLSRKIDSKDISILEELILNFIKSISKDSFSWECYETRSNFNPINQELDKETAYIYFSKEPFSNIEYSTSLILEKNMKTSPKWNKDFYFKVSEGPNPNSYYKTLLQYFEIDYANNIDIYIYNCEFILKNLISVNFVLKLDFDEIKYFKGSFSIDKKSISLFKDLKSRNSIIEILEENELSEASLEIYSEIDRWDFLDYVKQKKENVRF